MKKIQKSVSFLAIDPGKNGGLAIVDLQHSIPEFRECHKMPKTERETATLIAELSVIVDYVFIENINGWMGKFLPSSRMFTMGYWYGVAMSAAVANNDKVSKVMAHKWQRDLGLDAKKDHPKDWKKYLHLVAKQNYPEAKICLQVADAVLIAMWAGNQYAKKLTT